MNCLLKAVMVETLPRINHLAGRIDKNKKREAVAGKFVVKCGVEVVVGSRDFLLRPELRGFLIFVVLVATGDQSAAFVISVKPDPCG